MNVIVETQQELEQLLQMSHQKCFIDVISENDYYHPKLVDVVAVYIHAHKQDRGYIIPISHSEGQNLGKTAVFSILKQFIYLYTISKKELIYHGLTRGILDVSLLAMLQDSRKIEINTPLPVLELFYRYQTNYKAINSLIPLVKLYERSQHRYNSVKSYLDMDPPDYFHFYNDTALNVLYLIEQQGIKVNRDVIDVYQIKQPQYNITKGRIYTGFNPYNVTTRPSNSFNSINFAAIPKSEEFRKVYKPANDVFVQFDFDSYHLRLLSNLIGYKMTEESGHMQLARQYFHQTHIGEEDYGRAKQLNFEAMYGKIPKEYEHLEFFVKLKQFINKTWSEYKTQGYILDPISKRVIKGDDTLHAAKLLNYLIQSIETSRNMLKLKAVLNHLKDKETKVVHYIYDAVILDVSKKDGREVLETVKTLLSDNGEYPVKFSYSQDFCL